MVEQLLQTQQKISATIKQRVTGKEKKGGASKAGGQKPKVDPSSFMGRQVGGDKGSRYSSIKANY